MKRGSRRDALVLASLCVVGLALRWWRLDLISFRYDFAEAMFRVRETLSQGFPPFTGIVNSLGFRNPPGLIWLILPPALVFPDPRWSTAWIGAITMLGLWPLYRIGRTWLRGAAWIVPCVAYVCAPSMIFSGRHVWAQNVVPALSAWALWWLLSARRRGMRPRRAAVLWVAAGLLLLVGGLVHVSVLAWLLVWILSAPWKSIRQSWCCRPVLVLAAAAFLAGLLFIPSLLDWMRVRSAPDQEKPLFVQQFETMAPPPPGLVDRLSQALGANFEPFSSISASGGLETIAPEWSVRVALCADWALVLLVLGGVAVPLLRRERRVRSAYVVLVPWCLLPGAVGALLLSRMNPSYAVAVAPAAMILAGFPFSALLARAGKVARILIPVFAAVVAVVYVLHFVSLLRALDSTRYVNRVYYIPLANQLEVARFAARQGVPREHLFHMSGDWYAQPYRYLHAHVCGAKPALEYHAPCAVIQDAALRRSSHPESAAGFEKAAQFASNSVSVVVFPDPDAMETFLANLRRL